MIFNQAPSPVSLNLERLRAWREDGFIVLRDLFTADEIAQAAAEADGLLERCPPLDRHNGATEVFPGYHHGGSLSAEDGQYHELPPGTVDESRGVLLELDPGDVAIFGGFTPHRSGPNQSSRRRRQLFLSYKKQSDGGEQRERHYAEFHAWLRAKYGKTDAYFE